MLDVRILFTTIKSVTTLKAVDLYSELKHKIVRKCVNCSICYGAEI